MENPVQPGLVFQERWATLSTMYPRGRDGEEMATEQLVLPMDCRPTVLSLAHNIPLARHLG